MPHTYIHDARTGVCIMHVLDPCAALVIIRSHRSYPYPHVCSGCLSRQPAFGQQNCTSSREVLLRVRSIIACDCCYTIVHDWRTCRSIYSFLPVFANHLHSYVGPHAVGPQILWANSAQSHGSNVAIVQSYFCHWRLAVHPSMNICTNGIYFWGFTMVQHVIGLVLTNDEINEEIW